MGLSHLTSVGITDVGVKRKNNEDSIITLPEYGVFCVADGMGGAQGGEVASNAVVTHIEEAFTSLKSPEAVSSVSGRSRLVIKALNKASRWIKQRSDQRGTSGTGSTAVVIVFDARNSKKAMILHAGDSRAYRLRHRQIEQLSKDHTVAAAAGLTDETELPPMFRGVVTRAVGVKAKVEVESTSVDVLSGDIYLLASDGLDKLVSDECIREILLSKPLDQLEHIAQALIDKANHSGGVDNVSVVLVVVGHPVDQEDDMAGRYTRVEENAEDMIIGAFEEPVVDPETTPTPTSRGRVDVADYPTRDSDTLEGATPVSDTTTSTHEKRDRGVASRRSWWQKIMQWPMVVRVGILGGLVVLGVMYILNREEPMPDEMSDFDSAVSYTLDQLTNDVAQESEQEVGDRILAMLGEDPERAEPDKTVIDSELEGERTLITGQAENEKLERERLAVEREEQELLARQQAEQQRQERERAEAERLANEKAEQERLAAEREEQERLARQQAKQQRQERERAEAERLANEKAEQERLTAERAEWERLVNEQAERESLEREQAEAERRAEEKEAIAIRVANEKQLAERQGEADQQLENIRIQFTEVVKTSMQRGDWGRVEKKVNAWEKGFPGLTKPLEMYTAYAMWLAVWKDARESPATLDERVQRLHKAVADVAKQAGFEAPKSSRTLWDGSDEELATTYCAEQYRLQQGVLDSLEAFLDVVQAQVDAFGANPHDTLVTLWKFAGLSNAESLMNLSESVEVARAGLLPIRKWFDRWNGLPMSVEDLNNVPVADMERMAQRCDEIWEKVYSMVEFIAPQVSVWKNWEDDEIATYLDEITKLQKDVVLSRGRYGNDFRAWRLSEDHVAMEELMLTISTAYPLLKAKTDAAAR